MKKFISLFFITLFYSTNGYALHAAGVTQPFETGLIEADGFFVHTGDSHVDLSLDPFDSVVSTLTINDFTYGGFAIDSYVWDLEAGLGIESECVSLAGFCPFMNSVSPLNNISITTVGGSLQYYFNDVSGEGGDLFFADDVIIDADFLNAEIPTHLHIASVPLPGSVVLLSSGLMLLVGAARRKHLITK